MTLTELKAKAYDCIAQIDFQKRELAKLNVEIAKAMQVIKERDDNARLLDQRSGTSGK